MLQKLCAENYIAMDSTLQNILEQIAKTGAISPIHFVRVLRLIPGYDPKMAPGIEDQWFGGDGFPALKEPAPKRKLGHASDCAVNSAPAYDPRECDCGAQK